MKTTGGDKVKEHMDAYKVQVNRAWTMGEQKILNDYRVNASWGWKRIEKMTASLRAALDEIDKQGEA